MKYLYILFLISLPFSYITGQHRLLDSTKIWYLAHHYSGYPIYGYWTDIFRLGGDTTIESTLYQTILFTEDTNLLEWEAYAALREDSLGRVYQYDKEDSTERLIYDFTLSVGDTFFHKVLNPWSPEDSVDTMHVTQIDTIPLVTGEPRKRISLWGLEHHFQWIEGIGSSKGLLYDSCAAPHVLIYSCWLSCVMENGTRMYGNTPCILTDLEEELEAWNQVQISPNPWGQEATLEFNNPRYQTHFLDLYSLHGQLVRTFGPFTESPAVLHAGDLSPGIYLFRFYSKKGVVAHGKTMIQ